MNLKILFFVSFYIFSNSASSQSIINVPNSNQTLAYQPNSFSLYKPQNLYFKYTKGTNPNYLLHHNFNTTLYISTTNQSVNNSILYQNAKSLSKIQNKSYMPIYREGTWDNPLNVTSLKDVILTDFVYSAIEIWNLFKL
ncbi:hypothetical protein [Aquimarina longa]|uniref:hypothetical protein n=1 Tax=Aquimarina longa TaxID=1080221 RepID=UPI000783A024|nr:hypothetical protein [Aquimarina longa]